MDAQKVTGVDISPHLKPLETPENLWLQLDDLNEPFTFQANTFDLVNSSLVAGGINATRWPNYVRDMVRVLKPGGWLQMVEIYFNCQSDNGSLTDNHALSQWSQLYLNSLAGIKDLRAPLRMQEMMAGAGLTDVASRMFPLGGSRLHRYQGKARLKKCKSKGRLGEDQDAMHRLMAFVQTCGFAITRDLYELEFLGFDHPQACQHGESGVVAAMLSDEDVEDDGADRLLAECNKDHRP
ncbi:MAG: hypothetical protein M1829_006654 [Trizodia sp. TS-e1964]|nr:MAG: hypothetical protein M1829_006654 [Trizodia sp. TS-e1964]